MAELKGKVNSYVCQVCGKRIYTINRDTGTTPFMIQCAVTVPPERFSESMRDGCSGMMESSLYRNIPPDACATFEWYRPDTPEQSRLSENVYRHVERGGLLLRPIPKQQLAESCK